MAESPTQQAWDLRIVNADGSVAELIQLKATDSETYVNHAFERYPDVPIISTSDIADSSELLSTAAISNHDVTSQVNYAIDVNDSGCDALLQTAPLTVIAATEIYNVIKGNKSIDQAIENSGQRVALSAAAGVVGAAATAALGPVGLLAGVAFRFWLGGKVKEYSEQKYKIIEPESVEKEINPPPARKRKSASKAEARRAFRELENMTQRLLLEYKPN